MDAKLIVVLLVAIIPAAWAGAEPTAEDIKFFEQRIRPLLVERCFECHSEDSAESDLRLDGLEHLLRGGMRGPAIVPGKPQESLLLSAVRHGELLKMPPKEKLPAAQIADLASWIARGAPWPDAAVRSDLPEATASDSEPVFSQEERSFWAFQPPIKAGLPEVVNAEWVQSPIDAFILEQLETCGFRPAPPADRRTLIRRATLDLTGLPPTPEEVATFVNDDSPHAFAKLVDRLLASPAYGERWGRHWLDVARYADSNGLDENLAYANAFRYRDYVVAAFNKDKPFDLFAQEQVAGDLLPASSATGQASEAGRRPLGWDADYEGTVATGFLLLGGKMLAEDDPVKMQMDIIDEQVDTLSRAFLGLTLGCARCHDHKFDPLRTSDYYALAGIFKSTKTMEDFKVVARWQELPLATRAAIEARQEHQARLAAKQEEIDRARAEASETILAEAQRRLGDYLLDAWRLSQHEVRLATTVAQGSDPAIASRTGVVLLEAEEYTRGNVTKDRDSYGRGIGVLVNRGELPNFAEYDFELIHGGIYQVELRLAAAAARPCQLIINGSLVKTDAAGQVTGSWFPDSQTWFVEGWFELSSGKNTIRLEQPQFFPHIDKLLLVPVAEEEVKEVSGITGYQPLPELVRQWAEYLKASDGKEDSPFAGWRTAATSGDAADLARLASHYTAAAMAALDATSPDAAQQELLSVLRDPAGPYRVPTTIETHFAASTKARLDALRLEKKALEEALPTFPEAMAVSEGTPEDLRIHIRGSHLTLGRPVARRLPAVLTDGQPSFVGRDDSGRLELARWMTSDAHPLTARVIVNRVWLWHFGEGLVRSPDNFGRLGERPTHPELLDWLAMQFMESGWSIKELHRLLLLSATYQMSTTWNEQAAAIDPDNQRMWRFPRRRLEIEAIRDAMLAVSGQLDLTQGGSLLPTENRKYVTSTLNADPVAYQTNRRSIYVPIVRSALYNVFQAFDFAEPSVSAGQRQATTVAPQALFMMNSQFVTEQAGALAEQLLAKPELSDEGRVQVAYARCYSREPLRHEVDRALRFVASYTEQASRPGLAGSKARLQAWQSLCRALLSANEFVYFD